MNKYYWLVLSGVLAGLFVGWLIGWVWRAFYDQRKSEDFQRRRAGALAEGRNTLNDLRTGERAFAGDNIRLPSQIFSLTLISLKELNTDEDQVSKLLVRSGARAAARNLVIALQEADDEGQFASCLSNLELVIEPHGWSLADFGVTDIGKLRQDCRLRIARNKALEVTRLALTFSQDAALLVRRCHAAGCQVKDLSPEWVDALVQLAQSQDHEPGPRSRLNQ